MKEFIIVRSLFMADECLGLFYAEGTTARNKQVRIPIINFSKFFKVYIGTELSEADILQLSYFSQKDEVVTYFNRGIEFSTAGRPHYKE